VTKVLGISGSPRRGGNTEIVLDWALEGAESRGAETEKLVIGELDIAPCTYCDDCLATGQCTIADDMEWIYPRLEAADCLFLASPIFFRNVTAQVKAMIDRCQCLWVRRNVLKIPDRRARRRGLFISTAASHRPTEFQSAIIVVRAFFATLDVGYDAELLFGGMGRRGEISNHPAARQEAFALGEKLAGGEPVEAPAGPMALVPIGVVRNSIKEPLGKGREWQEVESEIVIRSGVEEALEGLEEFSHIKVIFWMHRVPRQSHPPIRVHPRGRMDLPLVGVFATRSPSRLNPIGISVVRLLERRGNILKVVGLDAIDGTPVVDIKPYLPGYDSVSEARVSSWVTRLR